MKIIIAFLTHNRLDIVRQCYEALLRHTPSDARIIWLDNASTDGTLEYMTSMCKDESIRFATNIGLANAYNMAMTLCDSDDLFVRFNSDNLLLSNDWLDNLITGIEQFPDAGQIANWFWDCDSIYRIGWQHLVRIIDNNTLEATTCVNGVCAIMPEARKRVGRFYCPPDRLWWPMSLEYGLRLIRAGLHSYYVSCGGFEEIKNERHHYIQARNIFNKHIDSHKNAGEELGEFALHRARLLSGLEPIYRGFKHVA